MLEELTLEGVKNKVDIAIERLKTFEPPEGYYLAFSGGKDSQCIYELAKMSGVKFDAHFNFTTVDPPELLKFIKENYPEVIWERPEKSMWELIENKHMPPTRVVRYCCAYLKERGNTNRLVVTGVRREESNRRRNRGIVDMCPRTRQRHINPIVDWIEKDVWEFIRNRELKYCKLYDEGYKRIGCIMCPMAGTKGMIKDAKRYPKFYKAYLLAFEKMLTKNREDKIKCNESWKIGQDVMDWWISGKGNVQDEKLFDEEDIKYNYE